MEETRLEGLVHIRPSIWTGKEGANLDSVATGCSGNAKLPKSSRKNMAESSCREELKASPIQDPRLFRLAIAIPHVMYVYIYIYTFSLYMVPPCTYVYI